MVEQKYILHDGVTYFNASQIEQAERRAFIADCLRKAVHHNQLDVAFQAQVDLRNGKHVGFEALARWSIGTQNISPAEFIPIADEIGLSAFIDMQTLTKSLKYASILKQIGFEPGRIAVNFGSLTLRNPLLPEFVKDLLDHFNLDADTIEIEVTEGVVIGPAHGIVKSNLSWLQFMGISVALDDFGTGYASLTHLRDLQVDKIKLDRSFVRDISTDGNSATIVQAVIKLAEALNIKVVGEGVETEIQMAALSKCGCHIGQGYLFHKPESEIKKIVEYLLLV